MSENKNEYNKIEIDFSYLAAALIVISFFAYTYLSDNNELEKCMTEKTYTECKKIIDSY